MTDLLNDISQYRHQQAQKRKRNRANRVRKRRVKPGARMNIALWVVFVIFSFPVSITFMVLAANLSPWWLLALAVNAVFVYNLAQFADWHERKYLH